MIKTVHVTSLLVDFVFSSLPEERTERQTKSPIVKVRRFHLYFQ
jgi:hypothetical protein